MLRGKIPSTLAKVTNWHLCYLVVAFKGITLIDSFITYVKLRDMQGLRNYVTAQYIYIKSPVKYIIFSKSSLKITWNATFQCSKKIFSDNCGHNFLLIILIISLQKKYFVSLLCFDVRRTNKLNYYFIALVWKRFLHFLIKLQMSKDKFR